MLATLTKKVKAALGRLAHYTSALAIADRRIEHFKERLEVAERGHHTLLATRARSYLREWRVRRRKLERLQKDWRGILKRRRQKKEKWLKQHQPSFTEGRWPTFDGQEVAPWMVGLAPSKTRSGKVVTRNWLQEIRGRGWGGQLISGIRTKAHSVELCFQICGAPSCSGRCAGETSNHNCTGECAFPDGAGDFTDPDEFNAISAEIDCPLINNLPLDPNHHSVTGD